MVFHYISSGENQACEHCEDCLENFYTFLRYDGSYSYFYLYNASTDIYA